MVRYCPVGDGQFDDDLDRCPECNRPLQDEPIDRAAMAQSDEVVWLVTAPNEPEAQMWANAIRAADMPVYVRSGGPGVGAWASVSSFEHDLMVRERDLLESRRILRELFQGPARSNPAVRARRSAPRINRVVRN